MLEPLVPATATALLGPCAEPLADWEEAAPLGLFLDEPREPTAACARRLQEAPDKAPLATA